MALYEGRGEVVLFGGATVPPSAGGLLSDTWVWDGTDWTQIHPTHAPSARMLGPLAYDPATDRLILGNGYTASGFVHETWAWDGTDWAQLTPTHQPYKILAMTHDVAQGNILAWVDPPLGSSETWIWNGSDWIERSPAHYPGNRADPYLAYQPASGAVILFGGGYIPGGDPPIFPSLDSETWLWNGTDWTQLHPVDAPASTIDGGFASCPSCGAGLLMGGQDESGVEHADAWLWDGTNWVAQSTGPTARQSYPTNIVTDVDEASCLLFGGQTSVGGATSSQTWRFECVVPGAPMLNADFSL